MKMSTNACPLCKGLEARFYSQRWRNRIVVCRGCGLFYVNPVPAAEELARRVAGAEDYTNDQLQKRDYFRLRAVRLFERVERLIRPGDLLDVGCSIGTELLVARERGWRGVGVELSRSALAHARAAGLTVHDRPLEACAFADASYDLVTANHVFEHVIEIGGLVGEIRRVLRPGGYLFVSVPNLNGWKRYIRRGGYFWCLHDDHFLHFAPRTLRMLLERNGFQVREARTTSECLYQGRPAGYPWGKRVWNGLIDSAGMGLEIFMLARAIGAADAR